MAEKRTLDGITVREHIDMLHAAVSALRTDLDRIERLLDAALPDAGFEQSDNGREGSQMVDDYRKRVTALCERHRDLIPRPASITPPPGWIGLLDEMLDTIRKMTADGTNFRLRWVKEKRGRLVTGYESRGPSRAAIDAVIEHYEEVRSIATCQICGAPGTRDVERWPRRIMTTCAAHRDVYDHEH